MKGMKTKGQVSPDFLAAIMLLGIMALTVFGVYSHMHTQAFNTMERINARDLAQRFSHEINNVVAMGDGAQRSMTMPATVEGGHSYNVTIRPNAVLIQSKASDYVSRFSTADINQTQIRLVPGEILIKNINGKIYVERIDVKPMPG